MLFRSSIKNLALTEGKHRIYFVSRKSKTSQEIIVQRNTHQEVVFNFEEPLEIQINSSPSGADVLINNRSIGTTPARTLLLPGDYEITLSKSYYKTLRENLSVPGAGSIPEPVKYSLDREKFNLTINSGDDLAVVYSDNKKIGVTNQEIEVEAGKITPIKVESPVTATYRKSVLMNQSKSVNISLFPKVAFMIGGEALYLPDHNSFGYGGNLGLSINHFFIGLGGGIQQPKQEDFSIDVTHQNVTVTSNNYSYAGVSYIDDAMGIYMYGKAGFFIYRPFKLFVSSGFGYQIGPEYQIVYRAGEDLFSESFITLAEGSYFTQPQTIQVNSSYVLAGIAIPLFKNAIQLGADVWFGNDNKRLYNVQFMIPFGFN